MSENPFDPEQPERTRHIKWPEKGDVFDGSLSATAQAVANEIDEAILQEIRSQATFSLDDQQPVDDSNIIYDVTENLLRNVFAFVDNDEIHRNQISPIHYAIEFATVKVGGHRQMGHTTALKMLADEYHNVCVVVPTVAMMKNNYRDVPIDTTILPITTIGGWNDQIEKAAHKDDKFTLCLIDNTGMLSQKELDMVYAKLVHVTEVFVQFQ